MQEIAKKEINITDLPPKLRKLALYLIENIDYSSLKDACQKLDLNYNTICTRISELKRKKGINFYSYVNDKWSEGLKNNRIHVRNALVNQAITGASADRKLYFQLTGDLKDQVEIDHKITGLFAVVGSDPNIIPADIVEKDKIIKPDGKQIIDIDYED